MSETADKRTVLQKIVLIKNIVAAVILVFLVAIIILTTIARINGNSPSVFGFSLYRVSTGSMKPELEVGDVILSKAVDPMELRKGDIVTFNGQSRDLEGKIITHRVITEAYEDAGEYYIVTKGDANQLQDEPVNTKEVLGVLVTKFNILKILFDFFVTPLGLITILLLIVAAFFGEIVNLIRSIMGLDKDRKDSVDNIIEKYQNENLKRIDEVVDCVVEEEEIRKSFDKMYAQASESEESEMEPEQEKELTEAEIIDDSE